MYSFPNDDNNKVLFPPHMIHQPCIHTRRCINPFHFCNWSHGCSRCLQLPSSTTHSVCPLPSASTSTGDALYLVNKTLKQINNNKNKNYPHPSLVCLHPYFYFIPQIKVADLRVCGLLFLMGLGHKLFCFD